MTNTNLEEHELSREGKALMTITPEALKRALEAAQQTLERETHLYRSWEALEYLSEDPRALAILAAELSPIP